MGKFIDLTGRKFGDLTVLAFHSLDKRYESRWSCQCSCGRTTEVLSSNLRTGHTRSCGFKHKIRTYKEDYSINFTKYKRHQVKKKYSMTIEQYNEKLKQQNFKCGICGKPIYQGVKNSGDRACLDHDHKTGQVRDFLCSDCNFLVGHIEKSSARVIVRAMGYMAGKKAPRPIDDLLGCAIAILKQYKPEALNETLRG